MLLKVALNTTKPTNQPNYPLVKIKNVGVDQVY
jgi:hypothetical protein